MDRRSKFAAIWVGLQLVFFVGWARMEEARQAEGVGHSVLVRTVPVDPRDVLRGQFIRLAYEFSSRNFQSAQSAGDEGDRVWVVLAPDAEFHVPRRLELLRPTGLAIGEVALRGTLSRYDRILYGIERYFVAEGSETPDASDLTVRLRIGDDGRARIETLYVRGVAWR